MTLQTAELNTGVNSPDAEAAILAISSSMGSRNVPNIARNAALVELTYININTNIN
jgi:hypothetical protein